MIRSKVILDYFIHSNDISIKTFFVFTENTNLIEVQSKIVIDTIREETQKWNWYSSTKQMDGEAFELVEKFSHLPFKIIKIERVLNDLNFIEYFASKACVCLKNSDEFVEEIGFYGSPSIDPNLMCTEKLGFDLREVKKTSSDKGFHMYEDAFYLHANNKCFREPSNKNICKIILAKQIVGQTSYKEKCETLKMPPEIEEKNGILHRYDSVTSYTETKRKVTITYENYSILPLFIITYDETKPKTDNYALWSYHKMDTKSVEFFDNQLNNQIELNFLSGVVTFPIKIESESFSVNLNELTMSSNLNHHKLIRRDLKDKIRSSCFYTSIDFDFVCVHEKINNSEVVLSNRIKNEIMESLWKILELQSGLSKASIKVIELDVNNEEYRKAKNLFDKNYKGDPKRIRKIEKIDNPFILIKYFVQKILLALKSNCIDEKQLFHGTGQNEPKCIYSDMVGFDMRYSKPGMWGEANYFAVNSSYSDSGYSYKIPNSHSKQIFIAKVLIGDSVKVMPNNPSLTKPPTGQKNGKSFQYDSVNGETGGSIVYMIYENSRAYPEYLVTYE